jgi:hypothetical protein
MGVSVSFGAQPALVTAGPHFRRHKSLTMGTLAAGCAIGGLCFPVMFVQLVSVVGFPRALTIAGFEDWVGHIALYYTCFQFALTVLVYATQSHWAYLRPIAQRGSQFAKRALLYWTSGVSRSPNMPFFAWVLVSSIWAS